MALSLSDLFIPLPLEPAELSRSVPVRKSLLGTCLFSWQRALIVQIRTASGPFVSACTPKASRANTTVPGIATSSYQPTWILLVLTDSGVVLSSRLSNMARYVERPEGNIQRQHYAPAGATLVCV